MNKLSKIKCPICNQENTWRPENAFKPFCSDRCKLIDLGEWASESRRIPTEDLATNEDDNQDD